MSVRRHSREMSLQLLYQLEVVKQPTQSQGGLSLENTPKNLLRDFVRDFEMDAEVADYGGRVFLGVCENKEEIDRLIEANARHWKIARMSLVDVSILRVACFEMKYAVPAVTPAVAIDEAIELARQYGSTDSASFVNGILDPIARQI